MEGLKMKYFVLKPEGNDVHAKASRHAMRHYSDVIEDSNPVFAEELRKWADKEEPEKTYHIGMMFKDRYSDVRYLLVSCTDGKEPRAGLINMENGEIFTRAKKVRNVHRITEEEFQKITGRSKTRFHLIKEEGSNND